MNYKEHDFVNGYVVSGIRKDNDNLVVIVNGDKVTLARQYWCDPIPKEKLRKEAELERRKLIFILKGGKPRKYKISLLDHILGWY